jgi:small subunit ribosomal protein S4
MKLESRIDSFLYRTGLASTRRAARQMASHGHVTINGHRVTIPSYALSIGDVVTVRDASRSSALFEGLDEKLKERALPTWITFDVDNKTATLTQVPAWGERDSIVDFGAVFEYYTR